jgi:DNA-binding PucR family transcriptional regulator
MEWEPPSQQVQELIRRGAEIVVKLPQEWLDEMNAATLASEYMRTIAGDPVLAEAIRRSNRANLLHWAAANISHPGEPVAANLSAETLGVARDLVRRGLDESAVDAYRIGQNIAWRYWMQIAFGLTSDPRELQELLDVSARSIGSFVDATIVGIYTQMEIERAELTRGTHAERREVVTLILDGAPITRQRAESRLGYRLGQSHTAAVVWTDESDTGLADLDTAVDALIDAGDGRRPLSVMASAATRWVWMPGSTRPHVDRIADALGKLPGVRVAIGPLGSGIEGFRRSHLDAVTTQRMMARLRSARRVASYEDVELVALITADPERADLFIKHTLGEFEHAAPELQETVLTFVTEQCNASRAAARLYTHRNTLLRRLTRAEELLPRSLEHTSVHVAAALEALRWRGTAG